MINADEPLIARCNAEAPLLEQMWAAMRMELARSGFANALSLVPHEFSSRELRRDAFDGSEALYGEWRSQDGSLLGSAIVHRDGVLFAEFDVVRAHPTDKRWFVEAVTAWGKLGSIKSELKLLPVLGP
jgi:hypothetical protein